MLTIKNLTTKIKSKIIHSNLNLTIPQGQIYVLMGSNGCGKSSLAKTIIGLTDIKVVTNRKTKIDLNKIDIKKLSIQQRSKLGIFLSFQEPVEIEGVTTLSYLRELYLLHHPDDLIPFSVFRKKIEKLAAKISFPTTLLDRSINVRFSGGEKKRLEILQLLLIKPKLAILDEIDTGLDLKGVKTIAKIINNLTCKNKMTSLVITHNLTLIKLLNTSKIYNMKKGKISLININNL